MTSERKLPEDIRQRQGAVGSLRAITLDQIEDIASEVQKLIAAGDEHSAWERLRGLHPADIGSIVAGLPRTGRERMLRVMSPDAVVHIFHYMNPLEAGRVGARLGSEALSVVFSQVNPRQALATVRRLPILRSRQATASSEAPVQDVELLDEQPDTASALMSVQFPDLLANDSVEKAIDILRDMDESRNSYTYLFILDDEERLLGQVRMVDLALADGATPLENIATPVIGVVHPDTPWDECARLRRHYNLSQLPVVDDGGKLIGVILAESLLGAVVEEDTRQMLQVASVAGEAADGPISGSIRTRLPWLTINLGTTFLAAATVALFESTLTQLVVLAAFLPVVAGQGGIGGTQTLTLIVRAIALGELVGVSAQRLLVREAVVGLIHGILLGFLVAVVAILWKGNIGLGLVLGVAMLGNMLIAGLVGAGVPLLLRRIGVDPAVASAVVVTTVTDVAGFVLFLGIATASLALLM